MSYQWSLIAGYLYFEVAVIIILMLPICSPSRWNRFFNSRLVTSLKHYASTYFFVMFTILSLFLLDSLREMKKYSHSTEAGVHLNLASGMKDSVKLFRAQRNFYITGFAIFLSLVIRRMITMLVIQDELNQKAVKIMSEADKIKSDAEAAIKLAKTTMLAHKLQESEEIEFEELKKLFISAQKLLKEKGAKIKELEESVSYWKKEFENLRTETGYKQEDEDLPQEDKKNDSSELLQCE